LALDHALRMVEAGATVIDVGGESTKPGVSRVDAAEEQHRVLPVIERLAEQGIVVSIDTMRADTAQRALDAGAQIINDVSGGNADSNMLAVVASSGRDVVLMHWRGHSEHMDSLAHYDDVLAEVKQELIARVEAAREAGIAQQRIILDPGLGFAKAPAHNWALASRISEAVPAGFRTLVGASRKRFLGELLPEGHAVEERDSVSAQLGARLADQGVWALRVHNVSEQTRALNLWQAFREGGLNG
jgi:dihydropteroate synthase